MPEKRCWEQSKIKTGFISIVDHGLICSEFRLNVTHIGILSTFQGSDILAQIVLKKILYALKRYINSNKKNSIQNFFFFSLKTLYTTLFFAFEWTLTFAKVSEARRVGPALKRPNALGFRIIFFFFQTMMRFITNE